MTTWSLSALVPTVRGGRDFEPVWRHLAWTLHSGPGFGLSHRVSLIPSRVLSGFKIHLRAAFGDRELTLRVLGADESCWLEMGLRLLALFSGADLF